MFFYSQFAFLFKHTVGTHLYRVFRSLCTKRQVAIVWGSLSKEWNIDMRRLTMRILSEKCVVTRFRRANVIECTYTNLDSIAYYTPRLYGIAYNC